MRLSRSTAKKGIFDLEDFAFFILFILIITISLVVVGFRDPDGLSVQQSYDSGSIQLLNQKEHLSGYLSTIMPSDEQLATDYARNEEGLASPYTNRVKERDFLEKNEGLYEGKTFAHFLAVLQSAEEKQSEILDYVSIALFAEPVCGSIPCNIYTYPFIEVQYKEETLRNKKVKLQGPPIAEQTIAMPGGERANVVVQFGGFSSVGYRTS